MKTLFPLCILSLTMLLLGAGHTIAQDSWYTQGEFIPGQRIEITLTNTLSRSREQAPVVIPRESLPESDFHELEVTVVDPELEPRDEPTQKELAKFGYHLPRGEQNGRMIPNQLDDLDKDGIWDELFIMTDLGPGERKTLYIYIGHNDRGLNPHHTAAGIGNYGRHLVPYWEGEYVGWKLWYPTDIDVYAKRTPQLMANYMIRNNLDGHLVPKEMGNDIMTVSSTLGGGGLVLFEYPDKPDSVSRPRFTPAKQQAGADSPYNVGQLSDTRYSFDVVVNGPLRSMIRANTFNWFSGKGFYELEQTYTSYSGKNYSTVRVQYLRFQPRNLDTKMGVGIRQHPTEEMFYQERNIVFTGGGEELVSPIDTDALNTLPVDFTAHALAVPAAYDPEFQFIEDYQGNYVFKFPPTPDHSFRYLIASAWSEGKPFDDIREFLEYVKQSVGSYENPVEVEAGPLEFRGK